MAADCGKKKKKKSQAIKWQIVLRGFNVSELAIRRDYTVSKLWFLQRFILRQAGLI